jgi:hypothetical protein
MSDEIDPRLAFLARAAARYFMVEQCEMSLDEAFDGLREPEPSEPSKPSNDASLYESDEDAYQRKLAEWQAKHER